MSLRRGDVEERMIIQPLNIGKVDVQVADLARAATKQKALTGNPLNGRLDSLKDREEDIDKKKDYQHATFVYTYAENGN